MKVILLDHYDSFTGNVQAWLEKADFDVQVLAYDSPQVKTIHFDCPVVIGPGPKAPQDVKESLDFCERAMKRVSVFGVCLGHQIICSMAGLSIIKSREPHHGSRRRIELVGKSVLFRDFPSFFYAATYNSLVGTGEVEVPWKVTARNSFGEIEAIENLAKFGVFGVQFHPESFLSEHAAEILFNWRKYLESQTLSKTIQ